MAVFENMMSDLYFNEESDYSGENTCGNKVFLSNIFRPFHFESEQKKTCGNGSDEKGTKYIHPTAADLLHIRIGNLDWCKCRRKNKAGEIDCL